MTWKAEEFCGDLRIVDGDGEVIAELRNPNDMATALKMAAAEDMLSVLKLILEDACIDTSEMWSAARAAITKATGS